MCGVVVVGRAPRRSWFVVQEILVADLTGIMTTPWKYSGQSSRRGREVDAAEQVTYNFYISGCASAVSGLHAAAQRGHACRHMDQSCTGTEHSWRHTRLAGRTRGGRPRREWGPKQPNSRKHGTSVGES